MALDFNTLRDSYLGARKATDEYITENDDRNNAEYKNLIAFEKKVSNIVLGHPESFEKAKCWMVIVRGEGGLQVQSEQELEEFADELINTDSKVIGRMGSLASEVRKILMDYNIAEAGASRDDWYLGCHCTEKQAKDVCEKLYKKFKAAIGRGLLVIERESWYLGFTF